MSENTTQTKPSDILRTRHPELLFCIDDARILMRHYGSGNWTDDQLLASYTLAVVRGGYHNLSEIKECGPQGVEVSVYPKLSTFDNDLLTRIVLVAHRMGVRIEIGLSEPKMVKLKAYALHINDDKDCGLHLGERHPSIDYLVKLCQEWKSISFAPFPV